MMRKQSIALSVLVLFTASQVVASSLGIARSSAPYAVNRAETVLQGSAERPVTVNSGDKIRSGSGFLKIETLEGETVLLDENSALAVMDNALSLEKGRVAVAMPNKSDTAVHVYDLEVSPIADEKADQSQISNLGVGTISENEVELYSQGRMFRVTSLPDGNQIAVIGASDALRLMKDSAGMWRPITPLAQDQDNDSEKAAANDSENTKRRRGFWIFPSAGAAAAVGVAAVGAGVVGYTVYQNNNDDGGDDDDEEESRDEGSKPDDDEPDHRDTTPREPSSPPRPTRTPQPTMTPLPTMTPTPLPTSTPVETEFL
ncbi:hypothetical protein IT570_06685 [Candidatus Sumerlaeota bacterium]|nr:hypothetical protein [Candidatus Sumerlaeota bacterium]